MYIHTYRTHALAYLQSSIAQETITRRSPRAFLPGAWREWGGRAGFVVRVALMMPDRFGV